MDENTGILDLPHKKLWAKFAHPYVGPSYKDNNCDKKLEAAFDAE